MKKWMLFSLFGINMLFFTMYPQSNPVFQKVVASDRYEGDNFGWSSAIDSNYTIVGAIAKRGRVSQTLVEDVGAAYIFKKDISGKWKEVRKLEPDQSKASSYFGRSVSISGSYAVVGADGEDDGEEDSHSMIRKGAVYVYKHTKDGNWARSQKIQLAKRDKEDDFGYSMSVDENFLAVSAPGKIFGTKQSSGAVYIYKLQSSGGWKPVATIRPPGKFYNRFGNTISLSGRILVVGNDTSIVYVYELKNDSTWDLKASLKASVVTDRMFGNALSIHNDQLLVGASGDFDPFEGKDRPATDSVMQLMVETGNKTYQKIMVCNTKHLRDSLHITPKEFKNKAKPVESQSSRVKRMAGAGAAYLYKKDKAGTWILQQRIVAADRDLDEHFGNSVALSDSIIAVSAFGDKLEGDSTKESDYAGAAYIFKLNKQGQWVQTRKLIASPRSIGTKFGFSLGVYNKTVIIGSRFEKDDVKGKNPLPGAGAAYIYEEK